MEHLRILVVEDKSVVAEDLKLCLQDFGYTVVGVTNNGEDAIKMVETLTPDIILMDININGPIDGVETVNIINQQHDLPVIYLTAYSDNSTIERAKNSHPSAYLVKPFDPIDLKIAIDIAIENFYQGKDGKKEEFKNGQPVVTDSLFIKIGEAYQKVHFDKIKFLEADGSYTKIHTNEGVFTLSINLKAVHNYLPPIFHKIHRSYIVHIERVTGFDKANLFIDQEKLPISVANRKVFVEKFLKV